MARVAFLISLSVFSFSPLNAQTSYPSTILSDRPNAYWRMGEPAGSPGSADASGNHKPARAVGGVTFGIPGVLPNNTAADLTGTGYFLTPLLQNNVYAYTLEAWVNTFQATAPVLQDRGYSESTNGNPYSVTLSIGQPEMSDGAVHCGLDGTNIYRGAISQNLVNDGVWHHIVCTFNGVVNQVISAQQFAVYIDGQPQAVSYVAFGTAPAPKAPISGSNGTTIGIHPIWQEAYSLPKFTGYLDEVAVYGYALTPAQVLSHYEAACPNGCN